MKYLKHLAILLVLATSMAGAQESIHINDAGTLREITEVHINDAGTLREIEQIYINDAGTLRLVFTKPITLDAGSGVTINQDDFSSPWNTTVGIRFTSAGLVQECSVKDTGTCSWTSRGSWIDPAAAASGVYDVRFLTGCTIFDTTASSVNAWIALSSTRTYTRTSTIEESATDSCTFEVRDGGGAPPATASDTYTISFDNQGIG